MSEIPAHEPLSAPAIFRRNYPALHGGGIDVLQIKPQRPTTRIPLIVNPGLGENTRVLETLGRQVAQLRAREFDPEDGEWKTEDGQWRTRSVDRARDVFVLEFTGRRETPLSMEKIPLTDGQKISVPRLEVYEAEDLVRLMDEDQLNIQQVDALSHSAGSLSLLIAAYKHPERFRNIVLGNPAGFGPNPFALPARFVRKAGRDLYHAVTNDEEREPILELTQSATEFAKEHPYRAVGEALSVARSNIYKLVLDLSQRPNAPKVAIVSAVDDDLFTRRRLQQMENGNHIAGFIVTKGRHDSLHYDPQFARAMEGLLAAMER